MDTIVFELVKKDVMINSIKGLRESEENAMACSLRSRARDISSYRSINANEVE